MAATFVWGSIGWSGHVRPRRAGAFVVVAALSIVPASRASAGPLTVVNVSRSALNVMFNPTSGFFSPIFFLSIPTTNGVAVIYSRTYRSDPGSPAAGRWVYEYQIDMTQVVPTVYAPCVFWFDVPFGPISALDYDHDAARDQVFVVTSGGLGTMGPSSASSSNGVVTFNFDPGVCASDSGDGDRSYSFGLTSWMPPAQVTATVGEFLIVGEMPVETIAPTLRLMSTITQRGQAPFSEKGACPLFRRRTAANLLRVTAAIDARRARGNPTAGSRRRAGVVRRER